MNKTLSTSKQHVVHYTMLANGKNVLLLSTMALGELNYMIVTYDEQIW